MTTSNLTVKGWIVMVVTNASDLVKKYVDGLKQAFYANGGKEEWDEFEGVKEGASHENILKLKELYPEIPDPCRTCKRKR